MWPESHDFIHLTSSNTVDHSSKITDLYKKGSSFRDIENSVNLPMQIKDKKVEVGVSFGVAIYPDDGEDFDALLRAADEEMYKAKRASRSGGSLRKSS